MCCGGCGRVLALVFLIIATAACVVHFIAPFWTFTSVKNVSTGLWGKCPGDGLNIGKIGDTLDSCTWFSEENFEFERHRPGWFYACQGLSAFGILLMALALPTGCGALCCCHSSRLAYFTGVTTVFSCLLQAASVVVWGYFTHVEDHVTPFVNKAEGKYTWGYYMGIGGVILGFVAGGLFFSSRRKS